MIKKLLTIFVTTFILSSNANSNIICQTTRISCPEVYSKDIYEKDGLFYKRFTSNPYTGNVLGKDIGFIKKGKKEGLWVGYNEDGTIRYKVTFKNGKWTDGSYNGLGTYKIDDDTTYEGEIINGLPSYNGKVILTRKNIQYEGFTRNELPHGEGTLFWKDGDKYIGQWKNGKRHGEGTHFLKSGSKYIGQWRNDKEHGQGTYFWKSGSKYIGQWKNGKRHGEGTHFWKDGTKFIGQYKDDKKHGQGTTIYQNGNKYVSEYKNGEEYGKGIVIRKNKFY